MHIVEVCRPRADLGAVMAQMRTWADHHKIEPSLFEVSFLPGREVRFRLQFQSASDAFAFAAVFEGEVLGGAAEHAA